MNPASNTEFSKPCKSIRQAGLPPVEKVHVEAKTAEPVEIAPDLQLRKVEQVAPRGFTIERHGTCEVSKNGFSSRIKNGYRFRDHEKRLKLTAESRGRKKAGQTVPALRLLYEKRSTLSVAVLTAIVGYGYLTCYGDQG